MIREIEEQEHEQDQEQVSLSRIEGATKRYADARSTLGNFVEALQIELEKVKRAHMADIKSAVGRTKEREDVLRGLVESAPGLFVKPRTVIFHGIKVGFQKGKGTIEIEDEERTIGLIRKCLPDMAEVLIKVSYAADKAALKDLPVGDLKRIGCTVEGTMDVVVVRAVDSEVDKVVKALLAEERTE